MGTLAAWACEMASFGLRHHRIISSHQQLRRYPLPWHHGPHGRKRFVTRCIKESDVPSVLQCYFVRTNMLRVIPPFTGNYVCIADIVEQEVLPWSTWPMMVTIGALGFRSSGPSSSSSVSKFSGIVHSNKFYIITKFACHQLYHIRFRRWLMDTMMPRLIHLLITSAKLTSIRLASSLTEINSVTCNLLPSVASPSHVQHVPLVWLYGSLLSGSYRGRRHQPVWLVFPLIFLYFWYQFFLRVCLCG